jgi:hypothetical protein
MLPSLSLLIGALMAKAVKKEQQLSFSTIIFYILLPLIIILIVDNVLFFTIRTSGVYYLDRNIASSYIVIADILAAAVITANIYLFARQNGYYGYNLTKFLITIKDGIDFKSPFPYPYLLCFIVIGAFSGFGYFVSFYQYPYIANHALSFNYTSLNGTYSLVDNVSSAYELANNYILKIALRYTSGSPVQIAIIPLNYSLNDSNLVAGLFPQRTSLIGIGTSSYITYDFYCYNDTDGNVTINSNCNAKESRYLVVDNIGTNTTYLPKYDALEFLVSSPIINSSFYNISKSATCNMTLCNVTLTFNSHNSLFTLDNFTVLFPFNNYSSLNLSMHPGHCSDINGTQYCSLSPIDIGQTVLLTRNSITINKLVIPQNNVVTLDLHASTH